MHFMCCESARNMGCSWSRVMLLQVLPLLTFFSLFYKLFFFHFTTFSDGCLGSGNDEGRRKMR